MLLICACNDTGSHNSLHECPDRKGKIAFLPFRNAGQSSWQVSSGNLYHTNVYSLRWQGFACMISAVSSSFSRNNRLVHIRQSQDYWYNHKLKWDPELSVRRKACLALSVFEVINEAVALWENDMSIIIGSHRREKPFLIVVFEATQLIWVWAIGRGNRKKKVRQTQKKEGKSEYVAVILV